MTSPATNKAARRYTFRKAERITRRRILEALFDRTRPAIRRKAYPLLFVWQFVDALPGHYPAQAAIVVGKRRFRKAVQRNRIKRRIRELYRRQKHLLYDRLREVNKRGALLILYIGNEETTFDALSGAFRKAFVPLIERIGRDAQAHGHPDPVLSNSD